MNRYIIFFFFLLYWNITSDAQIFAKPESSILQIDKTFYVSGETIWFHLTLPHKFSGNNIAIQAKIFSPDGELLKSNFLSTKGNNYIDGFFKVPYHAISGYYQIYFNASYNNTWEDILLLKASLPIYNDLAPIPDSTEWTQKGLSFSDNNTLNIISQPLANIATRSPQNIELQIQSVEGHPVSYGNLTVSVIDSDASQLGDFIFQGEDLTSVNVQELSSDLYFKGEIKNEEGKPYPINVLGVFFPKTFQFYFTKSDKEGHFILKLPSFHNTESFQFVNLELKEIQVAMKGLKTTGNRQELPYNKKIADYLIRSKNRKKIDSYFKSKQSNILLVQDEYPAIQLECKKTVNASEYQNFENLATFFKEVPNLLLFKKAKDKTYTARVQNPKIVGVHKEYGGAPLFIIDGKVTRNANFIGHLEKAPLQKAQIFFQHKTLRKYFKIMGQYGAVVLETETSQSKLPENEEDDIVQLSGYQAYSTRPDNLPERNIPVFRNLISWQPLIKLTDNGKANLSFTTPDNTGHFNILIASYGKNGLFEGTQILTYTVD